MTRFEPQAWLFDALHDEFDLALDEAQPLNPPPARDHHWGPIDSAEMQGFVWINSPHGTGTVAVNSARLLSHGSGIILAPCEPGSPWFHAHGRFVSAMMFLAPELICDDGAYRQGLLMAVGARAKMVLLRASRLGLLVTSWCAR